jgi:uncharacterized membrane protein
LNGEERLLNGYQVFAMIEQVSRVHRNKKVRLEVWKKHLKEIKKLNEVYPARRYINKMQDSLKQNTAIIRRIAGKNMNKQDARR